jgi:hypothetical protein
VFIVNQQEFHGEYEDYLPILMKHTEINAEMIGCTGKAEQCLDGLMRADTANVGKKGPMPNRVIRVT